jgi:hypothetical protein
MITERDIKRFWKKVNKKSSEECWEWTASIMNSGYGQFFVKENSKIKAYSSHRFSWMLAYGEIHDGLCVLHKCDNKICVNPVHLFLGTAKDNRIDAVQKGECRGSYNQGTKNSHAKLSESDVREIRRLYKENKMFYTEISKLYPISSTQIGYIIRNKSWKDLT